MGAFALFAKTEVVAVYYPHWHPYPKGEKIIFGEGKSEWELVKAQKPRYPGHPVPIKPLMGYYDETDPAVVAKEIDLAADSGIDVFMYDWYFYGNEPMMEEALDRGFLKAKNNRRMKFALMWCYHDRYNKFGARPGVKGDVIAEREKTPDEFRRCFAMVLEKYLKNPLYWHKDGHPFFSIFNGHEFVQAMGGPEKARALLAEADAKAAAAGLPSIHWNAMQGRCYEDYAKAGFKSCSAYNITCGDVPGFNDGYYKGKQLCEYRDVVKAHGTWWNKHSNLKDITYIPTVTRGWDCSGRCHPDEPFPWKSGGYPYSGIVKNNTPELFRQLLEDAKRYVETAPSKPGCVILNAWNEYTEGCWLVPDENIGTASLDAIRSVFGKSAPTPVSWKSFEVKPKTWPADDPEIRNDSGLVKGVKPIWIEGADWCGKPTRFFAWWGLPEGASAAKKVPAMVLVHGGTGTAYASWVKRWTDRGYAAIAMDTCGGVPRGECGWKEHPRHQWSGPYGWGDKRGYESEKLEDQWPYQAIETIIRSHSFLRSLPEVDAERTGITGISWGGYLTSIAAGVDHRFKFAAPVYGCGWYDRNPFWSRNTAGGGENYLKWLKNWDARHYIGNTRCPVLRCNGDMDKFYSMEMTAMSMAALPKDVPAALVIRHAMGHSHPPAGDPNEITTWANYYLKGGYRPLAVISTEFKDGTLTVSFAANDEKSKSAEVWYLTDPTPKTDARQWTRLPVAADLSSGKVSVRLPSAASLAYLTLTTEKGNLITSRIIWREEGRACGNKVVEAVKDDADALKWDPRFKEIKSKIKVEEFDWYDVGKLPIEGRGYTDEKSPFLRIPRRFVGKLPAPVTGMGSNTTGLEFSFRTDSPDIVLRQTVTARRWEDPFITPCGLDGCSTWARNEKGKWRFITLTRPKSNGVAESHINLGKDELCRVYFPIRAVMKGLMIGVRKGRKLEPVTRQRRVVHYGTSIVHGGCVSQSGLMWTSIYSRLLDCEIVNLGFSGAGRMEMEMADFLAGIETPLYIVDCDWNMSVELQQKNYEPFVRRLKELKPDVPILLCGGCTEAKNPREQEVFARGVFDKLKKEDPAKWNNLHFFSGVEQLPKCSWVTHDHCHPNDLGADFMGKAFAKRIGEIMGWK